MATRGSVIRISLIAAILIIAALYLGKNMNPAAITQSASQVSNEAAQVQIGGPFELVNQDGQAVTDKTYSDRYKLVYFGFTNCPMMCPTDLGVMTEVLNQIGPMADKIYPLFITVDQPRDDVAAMKNYLSNFHSEIQGLTGTKEQIANVAVEYKVFYKKAEDAASSDKYDVNHSGYMYLMDKEGNYVTHFNHGQPAEEIIAGLKKYL